MSDDEIDDRLSRRFDVDPDESVNDTTSEKDMSSGTSQNESATEASQKNKSSGNGGRAVNVKKEWNVRSIYLDDELDSDLSTAFKRLDLGLAEESSDFNLRKTRHFYPLVVALGLERLEGMEVSEVLERLEGPDSM